MATVSSDQSGLQTFLITGAVVAVLGFAFQNLWRNGFGKNAKGKNPPLYAGWLPWIGCAIEFGKAPVYFIDQKRKEVGRPIFSVCVCVCGCVYARACVNVCMCACPYVCLSVCTATPTPIVNNYLSLVFFN
jgi:hypothetical protein